MNTAPIQFRSFSTMLSQQDISFLEAGIGYEFTQKQLLQRALISAGAIPDEYDGNRKLANLGTSLMQFLLTYLGYKASASRSRSYCAH